MEASFLTRLFFNPADGDTFGSIFHVAALSAAAVGVWELFSLKERVFKPAMKSIGVIDGKPKSNVRYIRETPVARRIARPGGM